MVKKNLVKRDEQCDQKWQQQKVEKTKKTKGLEKTKIKDLVKKRKEEDKFRNKYNYKLFL